MTQKSKTTRSTKSTKSKTTRSTKPKTTRSTKPKTTRSTKPKTKKYSTKKKLGSGVVSSKPNPKFFYKLAKNTYKEWSFNDKIAFYVNHISFLKYIQLYKNLRHFRNKKQDNTGKVYPWVDPIPKYSKELICTMLNHFKPLVQSVNKNTNMRKIVNLVRNTSAKN